MIHAPSAVGAAGKRSIAAGGNVIGSILATGDHNQFFSGNYEPLKDAYIEPWSVFRRVRHEHFVGRAWLTAKIDRFLETHSQGYFVLEAQAGLGKSAYLAHLVKDRGYIHHFVELARGPDGITPALKNLAAQVILALRASPHNLEEALPSAAARADFLGNLLEKAARNALLEDPDRRIVIVVDGLDEAGTPPGHNVLGLPETLPDGVFFIVSHRPVSVELTVDTSREVFVLDADYDENILDMRAYLKDVATWEKVSAVLEDRKHASSEFVSNLLEKSRGVWVYLHHVIGEIEDGELDPLDFDSLPDGLWQYYGRFWQRWRESHRDHWYELHLPLLSSIAAVQEDASLRLLISLAEVGEPSDFGFLLDEAWRPFIAVREDEERRYRLYHSSLRDFIEGRGNIAELTSAQRALARELASATRRSHGRIADRYLDAWGGLAVGLPGLVEGGKRNLDGQYGLQHLAVHLAEGKRLQELHQLFSPPSGNAWYAAHQKANDVSGYLSDTRLAWGLAEQDTASSVVQGDQAATVGQEIRYALVNASLNSIAVGLPEELQVALLQKGVWTVEEELAYLRAMSNPSKQVSVLSAIAPYLSERELRGAVNVAKSIEGDLWRVRALAALVETSPATDKTTALREALTISRGMGDSQSRAQALTELAPYLTDATASAALDSACEIDDQQSRTDALIALAPYLPEALIAKVFYAGSALSDPESQARLLTHLVPHLPEPNLGEALKLALTSATKIQEPESRARVLTQLAPNLPDGQEKALNLALAAAKEIQDPESQARVLTDAVPALRESVRVDALKWALESAAEIKNEWSRSWAIIAMAPHIPDVLAGAALDAARGFEDAQSRSSVLVGLVPYLPRPLQEQAFEVARAIEPTYWRAEAISGIARSLPEAMLEELLDEVINSWPEWPRDTMLSNLAPQLSDKHLKEVFDAALAMKGQRPRDQLMVAVIPHLPDALLADGLDAIDQMQDPFARVRALSGVAPRLPEALLLKAASVVRTINDAGLRAKAIIALGPQIPPALLKEAVHSLNSIDTGHERAEAIAAVSPWLPEALLPQALEAVETIDDQNWRGRAMAALVPRLPAELLPAALAATQTISDKEAQAKALIRFVALLPPEIAANTLPAIVSGIASLNDGFRRRQAFESLVTLLAPQLILETASAARKIKDEVARIQMLTTLIPLLDESDKSDLVDELVRNTRTLGEGNARVWGFMALLPHLTDRMLVEALEEIRTIENPMERADLLAGIISHLPEPAKTSALEDAKEAARSIAESEGRVYLLIALAPYLRANELKELLESILAIEDHEKRAYVLTRLAEYVPQSVQAEALDAVMNIEERKSRVDALVALAESLPDSEKTAIVDAAWEDSLQIEDTQSRAEALIELAPQLDRSARADAHRRVLEAVRTTPSGVSAAHTLTGVFQQLSPKLKREGLKITREINDGYSRALALQTLAPLLPKELLSDALVIAREIEDPESRSVALAALASHLGEELNADLLIEAMDARAVTSDDRRREALDSLAGLATAFPPKVVWRMWSGTLPMLATRSRAALLDDLAALAPMVATLGGKDGVVESIAAIQDVAIWWP